MSSSSSLWRGRKKEDRWLWLGLCLGLTSMVEMASANNGTDDGDDDVSDYERVTALAYFSVIAFPLLICTCCMCSFLWGAFKNEYKPLKMYKETEDQGLFTVTYPQMVLGFEMKRGLIVRIEPGTTSDGKVRVGDRLWAVESRNVQGWSDEKLIRELMSHHERPLRMTFLRPNKTNPDVRHGIVATETRHFHAVTKGKLKGIPSFASFAGTPPQHNHEHNPYDFSESRHRGQRGPAPRDYERDAPSMA